MAGTFSVAPGSLASACTQVGATAQDVSALAGRGAQALESAAGCCGSAALEAALLSFTESWLPSIGDLSQLLTGAGTGLGTAAAGYTAADTTAGSQVAALAVAIF